jgi:hypothetical protein
MHGSWSPEARAAAAARLAGDQAALDLKMLGVPGWEAARGPERLRDADADAPMVRSPKPSSP